MFALCYCSYATIHIYREFWSISKPAIEEFPDKFVGADKQTLSNVDFTNFLVYGLSQFVNGPIADEYNQRISLPISFMCQCTVFVCMSIMGFTGSQHASTWFYLFQIVIGLT